MARIADHLAGRAFLDDAPGVHHRETVGHFHRGAHVVGDEDDGEAEFALQFAQQQQDLDLHGGVERGGGLIGEQHLWPAGQGERDHRALAHAAGHLVRIGVEPALGAGYAHPLEEFQRTLARLGGADALVAADGLDDLLAHRIHRIEGQQRLLENHRGDAAAIVGERAAAQREHVLAGDLDAALDMGAAFGVQSQQRAQRDALARAGFTDQGHGFTACHAEIDAIDGTDRLFAAVEGDAQVAHRDDRRTVGSRGCVHVGSAHDTCTAAAAAAAWEWPLPGSWIRQAVSRLPRYSRLGTRCEQMASASGQRV